MSGFDIPGFIPEEKSRKDNVPLLTLFNQECEKDPLLEGDPLRDGSGERGGL